MSRIRFVLFAMLAVPLAAAELRIEATGEDGKPLWTRMEVRGADGRMYQPAEGALRDKTAHVQLTGEEWYKGHFVVEGKAALQVPPGKYTVIAEHGPEFERFQTAVEVTEAAPAAVRVRLRPWIRMNDLGWWSGDMHVHRPLEDVPALMKTEELNVAISYTMWNTEQWSRNAWKDKPAPRETVEVVSRGRLHLYLNAEDERGGGAWMLLGLPGPLDMTPAEPWYPQGLRFVERARALKTKGGVLPWFELEKPIWWEAPVMMALGAPDSMSMLFNHFDQYGIHESEAWGRPRDQSAFPGPAGFVNYVLGLDYRYLNLGFRFALTAGSASGVLQAPVGYNRVYARVDGPLTAERWFAALKSGESFVTNGPMLFTKFRKRGGKVVIDIDARSRDPLDRIEVIANGRVIETVRPGPGARNFRRMLAEEAGSHSWMAVRCWQKEVPSIRLAHSMPFYLDGRWDASDDARYFVGWLDELIDITNRDERRFRQAGQKEEVLAVYRQAKDVYAAKAAASAMPVLRDIGAIDAHAHVFVDDPAVRGMLDRLNLRFVNITVVDPYERGYEKVEPQQKAALEVFRGSQGRAPWVATFDPADWQKPGFSKRVIADLDAAFRQGAVGVKIYKTIGMDLRDSKGAYVMPDDPAFAPILDAIAARGKTLYAHIAEPIGAWRPLDPADPDSSYYREFPRWHMYGRPDAPDKDKIIAARDRMLGQHPKLRVVGCHLGSNEWSVDEVAERLDRYPNYVVDTAGRVAHLALQPQEKVRAFLLKYQDRVLYATDDGAQPGDDVAARVRRWEADIEHDWKYFATDQSVEYMGRGVRGLALPEPVLRKIFRQNAEKWVPGIGAR
jgi:predicted TIM-barrel fold metal-dependent hydrolase